MNIDTKCNSLSDYEDINLCWQNFLTGIVVWDTVVYNICTLSELSYSMYENARKISPLNEYLKNENVFKVSCNRIDRGLRNLSFFEIAKKTDQSSGEYSFEEHKLIAEGIAYALFANASGFSYLPHPQRAEALRKTSMFKQPFDASIYLDILDKKIIGFIDEINKEVGRELQNIRFPLIYHYINSNAGSAEEELKMALYLREQKSVKKFRKSVDKIQKSLNKGNILDVKASIEQVHQLCDEITNDIYKKPQSFKVSLGLTPRIKSPDINLSLEKNDDIINKIVKPKIHTTFLYDLASFAVKGKDNFK